MYNYKKKTQALVNFSYTFISPKNKNKEAPLWNFLRGRKRGGITVEAAAVCSLAILIIGSFLFLFVVLKKEFELKQDMYRVQDYRMLFENGNEDEGDYVASVSISLLGFNKKIVISNTLKNYGFDGYNSEDVKEEIYVYVSKNGTVYHRD